MRVIVGAVCNRTYDLLTNLFSVNEPCPENLLKIRQRRLSRKVKASSSQKKARLVVAATHEKIANRRKDFHHQLSRSVVDRFGIIGLETLKRQGHDAERQPRQVDSGRGLVAVRQLRRVQSGLGGC
ncbi:MAG: hypothetical protein DYG89_10915 [Caldilinea sp. CFX5]|nr:hypothetical protein [Caldilinea sp. CFX5]